MRMDGQKTARSETLNVHDVEVDGRKVLNRVIKRYPSYTKGWFRSPDRNHNVDVLWYVAGASMKIMRWDVAPSLLRKVHINDVLIESGIGEAIVNFVMENGIRRIIAGEKSVMFLLNTKRKDLESASVEIELNPSLHLYELTKALRT
jgi:hypothetical protein